MLIPPRFLKKHYSLVRETVLHVGAHSGEEGPMYRGVGWPEIHWVEAQPALVEALRASGLSSSETVYEGCAWDAPGVTMDLNVTTNSQSSSVYDLGTHTLHYPNVSVESTLQVSSVRLDQLIPDDVKITFLNLDIQGAELRALRGFGERLWGVDAVYCEVNREELYEGIALVEEIDNYLEGHGLRRAVTKWTHANWGDALYLRGIDHWSSLKLKMKGICVLFDVWASYRMHRLRKWSRREMSRAVLFVRNRRL